MKRHVLMIVMAAWVVGICVHVGAAVPASGKAMNVLFLVIDDLNTWMLNKDGRYAGKVVAPNIRRLADSGVIFTRAYTASPKCSPSRTAFLMGVAPWESGHTENALDIKDNAALKTAVSFPKLFKERGYFMVSSGKIGHGYGTGVEWDLEHRHTRDPAPPGTPFNGFAKAKSGRLTERDWGVTHLKESEMNDTKVADCAIEALKMKHDKPFFIACGLFHPHMPWYVPKKYFDMYPLDGLVLPPLKEDDLDDIPQQGQDLVCSTYETAIQHNQYEKGVQAYLATTSYADAQMGRVLDALENSPYKDNTIVVLLSDHGFHVGEKTHWQKSTLWEDGTNVLLMYRVPGLTKAKQVCDRPVSLLDIYPTLTELTGLQTPEHVAGHSMVPLLQDVNASHDYPIFTAYKNHITIRTDRHRLIRYEDGGMELYDCSKDPNEWTNLESNPEYASLKRELTAQLPEFEMLPYVKKKNKN